MNTSIDIIIPTCKPREEVQDLSAQIMRQAGLDDFTVIDTCRMESAAHNRNWGLGRATSPIRIMIDDDITGLPFGWAANLVKVLEDFSECEMVSALLVNDDGTPAVMMGYDKPRGGGVHVVEGPYLLSACIAFRNNGLRYDEKFIGSGWEDTDMCMQIRQLRPGCTFMVNEDVRVIHANEMKNQSGHSWTHNRRHYISKWGLP